MQKVRHSYWTAAYCKWWHEKLVSFIELQYVNDAKYIMYQAVLLDYLITVVSDVPN